MRLPRPHAVVFLITFALAGVLIPSRSSAKVYSVQEFIALKSKWKSFAQSRVRLKIEGRFSSISRRNMRMSKSNLSFYASNSKNLRKPSGDSATVLVSGHLEWRKGKLVFIVTQLKPAPSDRKTFFARRNKIRNATANPQSWYSLAEWVENRGAFYKDEELKKLAAGTYRSGIMLERRQLAENKADGLFQLAAKVRQFNLPDSLRMQFVHEAHRIKWDALRKKKKLDVSDLTRAMVRDLPGSDVPLPAPQPKLGKKYGSDPLETYRSIGATDRKKLHRLFYIEVLLAVIESKAAADGSNGFEIAAKIDKQVPERYALAEKYRERELDFKMSQLGVYTRTEALQLADLFRRRKQPKKASETLARWLQAEENRLRSSDADGMRRLAEQYRNLIEDDGKAAELLKKAHKLKPKSVEIASMLKDLGYTFKDGNWLTDQQLKQLPVDPLKTAIRSGRVTIGMTSDQVLKALGSPASITRVATRGDINEVWTYGDQANLRVTVHLLRRLDRKGAKAQVVASY